MKKNNFFCHSSSVVDKNTKIGHGTKIWHFSHVSSGAKIGNNCVLGQNVFIGKNVVIGSNVKIQNNVSVYEGVIIEDDVFCGPSVVFTNVMNPRSFIERKNEFKKTNVKIGASIGANATIVCGIDIGSYSFIAAGAVVTKNVKNFALMIGVPALQKGWISKFGNKISLPLKGKGKFVCSKTAEVYKLSDNFLKIDAN